MKRSLGYLPDEHSHRDLLLGAVARYSEISPAESIDFRDKIPEILDQGAIGSCVANAGFGAIRLKHVLQGVTSPKLGNRLHGYWGARAYDDAIQFDLGCRIRNFFRFINAAGYMPEEDTTNRYATDKFQDSPSRRELRRMYDQRNSGNKVSYYRIDTIGEDRVLQIKQALSVGGIVEFGTAIAESFFHVAPEEVVEIPKGPLIGGHAMYLAGYSPEGAHLVNSWGAGWGDSGTATISWDYLMWESTQDLWVVDKAPYYSEAP